MTEGAEVIEFRVLGSLEVVDGDRPLALGSPQQRLLLAVLLVHRGEPVSSDRLIDELWGEHAPASANKIVQGYVSNLRKAFGNGLLVTRGHGYLLQTEPGQLDADRFESLLADGRSASHQGDPRTAAERLRDALALSRGPPFADFAYESFAQSEIARLEEAQLAALEERIDAELALGEHGGLVSELEGLVQLHPLRERLIAQLMLALYRSGRQADALERYRIARGRLVDELGIEPGRELQQLERAILSQDPGLELTARDTTREHSAIAHPRWRGGLLIAVGGAVLVGVFVAMAVILGGSDASTVRAPPNSLVAIDTRSDRVVAVTPVGARPAAVAFSSGSLWVANLDDQTVSRIDPATLRTVRTFKVAGPPTGLAAANGQVWVVSSSARSSSVSVSRIDPRFDVIGRTARVGNVVAGEAGAVAARGGTLWVAPSSGSLARLDSRTGRVVEQLDPNAGPAAIALGGDAVWVTDADANNVTRVDPSGFVKSFDVGHGPSGIAVGEGGVWVADTLDDAIVRIDPGTKAVTATIPVGHSPTGVSLGAGSVWVANSGDGTVTRIDPVTDKRIATIAVGGSPQAITFAGDRAWVTVDALAIPATDLAADGGTARLVSQYDVDSMDPAVTESAEAVELLDATCAELLNYPDEAGQAGSRLVPEVAQSLPVRSADGKTYTFTIRSGRNGFRFSPPSNELVTAQTFKYTIERTLNPEMRSPLASEFRDIIGARAYMAGRSAHVAGVVARANTLTIRLLAPAPDLPARIAEPAMCAVPSGTPADPQGVRLIPSAGPYRVASYAPGQGVELTRNPNYHGSRPHRLERIDLRVGISDQRAVAQVEAGTADYLADGGVPAADATRLAAHYGPGSPAAKNGRQQYFVKAGPQLDSFALNTHRPLFADVRLRRAVSYAINRAELARLGDEYTPLLPEPPTDHYLPPGVPGYRNVQHYPFSPDLAKARQLAGRHASRTAVLYTCNISPCDQQAQIVQTNLAKIGIRVEVKAFTDSTLYTKTATPGEPFDIVYLGWLQDYQDPSAFLNVLLEGGSILPTLRDPTYRARLAGAAQLTGAKRYLTYARL
ncbi:MAG TPA: ABC transporter substrate-binding protein, partial [Solirubrobacteraceae bacterium]